MHILVIAIIVLIVFGVPLYVMGKTFLGLGTYGVFAGVSRAFRGVATTKYTGKMIQVKGGRNLNGRLIKYLTVKKDTEYIIKCDVVNEAGEVKIKLTDRHNNILIETEESVVNGVHYRANENGKIAVWMDFDRFNGEVFCNL